MIFFLEFFLAWIFVLFFPTPPPPPHHFSDGLSLSKEGVEQAFWKMCSVLNGVLKWQFFCFLLSHLTISCYIDSSQYLMAHLTLFLLAGLMFFQLSSKKGKWCLHTAIICFLPYHLGCCLDSPSQVVTICPQEWKSLAWNCAVRLS